MSHSWVPPFFDNRSGSLRTIIRNIDATVKDIKLGKHNHAMFENMGANTVFVSPNTNTDNAIAWIEAGGNKVLDDYTDETVYLVCASGSTTTVRITVWWGEGSK